MNGTNSNVDRSGLWLVRPDGYVAVAYPARPVG
jgi:hypothetical protein